MSNQQNDQTMDNLLENIQEAKNKEEARQAAIDWQNCELPMSYGDLAYIQECLYTIGKRYGLIREFKREGIL